LLTYTSDHVVHIHKYQDDQERRAITDWLSSTDYSTQQSDIHNRCQEGTGEWLLNSREYNRWLDETGETLFCPGIPGAGKTMSSAIVIDDLWSKFSANNNIGIAFLFCSYKKREEQTLAHFVCSLLKQLVQERHILPNDVKSLHTLHVDRRTRPSTAEILKIIQSTASSYSRTFFIIDALDECGKPERNQLLDEIFKIQTKTRVNVLVTSRFSTEIETRFSDGMSLEIRASEDDMRRYLEHHIHQLPSCVQKNLALQKEIAAEIIKVANGMYVAYSSDWNQ
jgi:Cdc6-like AAA superfamily ATPase